MSRLRGAEVGGKCAKAKAKRTGERSGVLTVRLPARPATKDEQQSATRKEQIKIQFKIEKRMRTAPQIMIVTNEMGGGVGVTAEPALASGSAAKRMKWATI